MVDSIIDELNVKHDAQQLMEKKKREKSARKRGNVENISSHMNRNVIEEDESAMSSFIPRSNGLHLTNQNTSLNLSSGVLKQMVNDNTILNSTASQTLGL